MITNDSKKYYWLKLDKNFFKKAEIRIIESMPNGKDYILFYLKLLCESTGHEGSLRLSETIPYNDAMLSAITNTNIDIVRSAIKVFKELSMMEVLDDGTLYFEEVRKMIGSETGSALRKRGYREKELKEKEWDNVPRLSHDCPTEIDIDKELEKDKEKELIKLDKTAYSTHAIEITNLLIECKYIQLDPDDYVAFIEEALKEKDFIDVKVKVKYFIEQTCSLEEVCKDKENKPVFKWVFNNTSIVDRYNYFKTSIEKSFLKDEMPF